MTDLTEQWEKGELPDGLYWVDYYSADGAVMLEYISKHNGFGYDEKNLIQAVLAEVPDYIEWRNMVNCACEEHTANKTLMEENEKLKKMTTYTPEEWNVMLRQINRLKELLKEIRHITNVYEEREVATTIDATSYYKFIKKIDEVLK